MKRRLFIMLTMLLMGISVRAQDSLVLKYGEENVASLLSQCLASEDDAERRQLSGKVMDELQQLLQYDAAFHYNFESLKNISSIYSDDGEVRVLTFGVPLNRGKKYLYHGFVIHYDEENGVKVTRLVDDEKNTRNPQFVDMQASNWYGAVYYQVQRVGGRRSPVYALCGWDGADLFTNRKVLEQLTFDDDYNAKFGGSFQTEHSDGLHRIVFEFTEKAVMSLQYDPRLRMVIGDHLSAPAQNVHNPRFYGPDMSFDGYYYDKDQWFYEPDIDVKLW
ncbi:MAG: hypothetical protein K6F33_13155 [Bacteroidales bacterium]|nr:hypothetical protein [Bacteroidales bacterium]